MKLLKAAILVVAIVAVALSLGAAVYQEGASHHRENRNVDAAERLMRRNFVRDGSLQIGTLCHHGDRVIYLHVDGVVVDLEVVPDGCAW